MKHDPVLDGGSSSGCCRRSGRRSGHVALIGCGPGDPDLLTVKALRRIREANVLVADRLVNPAIVEEARPDAERIFVGKSPGGPATSQRDINAILVREARKGKRVARLKGGDPFIFGRAVEELAALQHADVDHEVVPGITAAHACAASAVLPVTSRGRYRVFSVLTGATAENEAGPDWRVLARSGEPFAIYMGVRAAARIEERLVSAGMDARAPAVIVENGTLPQERILATTIENLAACIRLKALKGPAVIFIGLDWRALGLAEPGRVEHFDGESVVSCKPRAEPVRADMPLWVAG